MLTSKRRGFGTTLLFVVIGLSLVLTTVYSAISTNKLGTGVQAASGCPQLATSTGALVTSGTNVCASDNFKYTCDIGLAAVTTPSWIKGTSCDACMGAPLTQCDGTSINGPHGSSYCGQDLVTHKCDNGSWVSLGSSCSCPATPATSASTPAGSNIPIGGPAQGTPADDMTNYGQSAACGAVSGTCQNSANSSCVFGTYQAGICPGPSYWQCCAVGGSAPASNPPSTSTPNGNTAQNGSYQVGGFISKSDIVEGIPGIAVTIIARKSDGTSTSTNVLTDASGNFFTTVNLVPGESYAVRPQALGPAGYASAPRSSNNTYSYAAYLAGNTPIGSIAYEQQVVGQTDCAGLTSWPHGACNFVYDPVAPPVVQPPVVPIVPGGQQSQPGAVTSTGGGAGGFTGYTRFLNDCSNGYAAAATYTFSVAGDPTQPAYYYNLESVTDANQAALGRGHLEGQARVLNGATFTDPHPAWIAANGGSIRFYVYTAPENSDPKVSYTIHGTDANGNPVSAAPTDPPPLPYVLSCPPNSNPPPIPGNQTPGGVATGGTTGSLTKKNMTITVRINVTQQVGGGTSAAPRVTSMPIAVKIVNGADKTDSSTHSVLVQYVSPGLWEGTITTSHFTGSQFAFSIWPFNGPSKTLCAEGPNSPHVLYPRTYQCTDAQGTITLNEGANAVDFSNVPLGAGDMAVVGLHDGHIDTQDLYFIQQKMGNTDPASLQAADLNFDNQINIDDYNIAVWSVENVSN